jgi:hypothetical protein
MSASERPSSREVLQSFDESIFKPRLDHKMVLPSDEPVAFEEVQAMDQLWIWVLMGLEFVIMIIALLTAATPIWTFAVCLGIMTMTMALLGSIKLYTRMDMQGVHFRMSPFHFKEKTILWDEIDQIYVRKYSPIMEYGGWGIRVSLGRGTAYNIKGNYGIQIKKKNGKEILLGTQSPDEAARHLNGHPLLV